MLIPGAFEKPSDCVLGVVGRNGDTDAGSSISQTRCMGTVSTSLLMAIVTKAHGTTDENKD